MKLSILVLMCLLTGCRESPMDDAKVLEDRFCECWMWGSPRMNPDRPPVIEWYNKRVAQGCPEYKNCGVCVVCGQLGHTSADPKDRSKDIELCDKHYLERVHE